MARLPGVEIRKPVRPTGGGPRSPSPVGAPGNRPAVAFLDQSSGDLDLEPREAMPPQFKVLNRATATTFLCLTHDRDAALTMSDCIPG